jgi:hypothetical protein
VKPYVERMHQEAARLRAALRRLEHDNGLHKRVPADHRAVRREVGRWVIVPLGDQERHAVLTRELRAVEANLTAALSAPAEPRLVVLVGCVATKRAPQLDDRGRPRRWPAADLYVSDLFRRRRAYAERRAPDAWGILSAPAGFLWPDQLVAPYDFKLSELKASERWAWACRVSHRLRDFAPPKLLRIEIHAGELYCRDLAVVLRRVGAQVNLPVAGLALGQQLRWYHEQEQRAT